MLASHYDDGDDIKIVMLNTNMRVHHNRHPMPGEFTRQILKIGDGKVAKTEDVMVVIPPGLA